MEDRNSGVRSAMPAYPCIAKVISHLDSTYMGSLEVQLIRPGSGNEPTSSQTQQVRYMSPFWGSTSIDFVTGQSDYDNTQKSYGMWMVPPDVGSQVIVIFINGDPARGYWIGCVPDDNMNFMVPGLAATENTIETTTKDSAGRIGRAPVAEYNKLLNNQAGDSTRFKKPIHPLYQVLKDQGLIMDDIRGITSSSSRREVPSMVFGFSTPGPFDKRPNAKTGSVGKADSVATNVPVSHLGGSTFVMDDGDDKFVRKTPASSGPPVYAAVEQGETGDVTIPHNELVRIRTRTGHQILLHNSEDLIYIGNSKGTTWIEMTSNGKLDIYANDSVSVHTENDLNFTADRDINLTAGNNINLHAGSNLVASSGQKTTFKSSNHVVTTGKFDVNNGATAPIAPVAGRVPMAEPWAGHENLNPAGCTPAPAATASVMQPSPSLFGQYTTVTDTFNKVRK